MYPIEIRAAVETDMLDTQLCAKQAFSKYVQRIGKEPAPIYAYFAKEITNGSVAAYCKRYV